MAASHAAGGLALRLRRRASNDGPTEAWAGASDTSDAAPCVGGEVFPYASNVPVGVEDELMATAVPVGRFHCQGGAAVALAGDRKREKRPSKSARGNARNTGGYFNWGAIESRG